MLSILLAGFALLSVSAAESLYENTPVIELSGEIFQTQVLDTRHPTIVEFYTPWCDQCKTLKPELVKAAKQLKGIANLAAVNCDNEENKAICHEYKIEDYPKIKIFGPTKRTKKSGSSEFIEDYTDSHTSKAIRKAMLAQLKSAEVKKVTDWQVFHKKYENRPRVVLASPFFESSNNENKQDRKNKRNGANLLATWKSLAIEFDQRVNLRNKKMNPIFAYMNVNTENQKNDDNHDLMTSFLALFRANNSDNVPVVHGDDMSRSSIRKFLQEYFNVTDPLEASERQAKGLKKRLAKAQKAKELKEKKAEPKIVVKDEKTKVQKSKQHSQITDYLNNPLITGLAKFPTADQLSEKTDFVLKNRIYTWSDIRKLCLGPSSKPCVIAVSSQNQLISTASLFKNAQATANQYLEPENQPTWGYFVDLESDLSNELSQIADTLGLRPYFPTDYKSSPKVEEKNRQQIEILKSLGFGGMNIDSGHWNHPPNCMYINGREGWLANFPKYTEMNVDSVVRFLRATINGNDVSGRKNLPKELVNDPAHDEL